MIPRYGLYFTPAPQTRWASFSLYGTLKAPFGLAPETTLDELIAELDRFSATQRAFPLPRLEVQRVCDVLAAVPVLRDIRIAAVAAECIARFDRFCDPLEPRPRIGKGREPGFYLPLSSDARLPDEPLYFDGISVCSSFSVMHRSSFGK